jgi:Transposase IS4
MRDLLPGTAVLRRLVSLWDGSGRIFTVDSYFSSVETTLHLCDLRLIYVGVVKTATRRFPKAYLGQQTLHNRVDKLSLALYDHVGEIDMTAMPWLDRKRRYFICTTWSTADGEVYQGMRWSANPSRGTACFFGSAATESG